jgi:Pentatricopeptide repeat domain
LLVKAGYPVTAAHHAALIRSKLTDEDYVGACSSAAEAEAAGIDLFSSPEGSHMAQSHGESLAWYFGDRLARSVSTLDQVYFSLVDVLRADGQAAKLCLDSVVLGAGKRGTVDRAFATFQEYQTLFSVRPDVVSYNALLCAAAHTRAPTVQTFLKIFERMESDNVTPDGTSFSYLFETMVETSDFKDLDAVIGHMKALQIVPSARSVRRLAVEQAKLGEWGRVDDLQELLRHPWEEGTPGYAAVKWPTFFRDRLLAIKAKSDVAAAPASSVGP